MVAQAVKDELKKSVDLLLKEDRRTPQLAAILIGNNGASETYVASKIRNCEEVGFRSKLIRLDDNVSEVELLNRISELNDDAETDGILVQLPLPKHINEEVVVNAIDPTKDVDGFHPVSAGRLVLSMDTFVPATPQGIMLMLEHYKIDTAGKHAVVIGRSNIVGRPISILLNQNNKYGNCTVTVCHSRSNNLEQICRTADIIIAAIGKPRFLTANMVKENAVVVDVGITRVPDATKKSGFAIQGDVDFESVAPKCSYISPVPGGVGLMTIAALLKNTWSAYQMRETSKQ